LAFHPGSQDLNIFRLLKYLIKWRSFCGNQSLCEVLSFKFAYFGFDVKILLNKSHIRFDSRTLNGHLDALQNKVYEVYKTLLQGDLKISAGHHLVFIS
jgi:hypothetical protein